MSSNGSTTKVKAGEVQLVAGLNKHEALLSVLIVLGKTVTVAQAIATIQARIDAITAAQAARIAWIDAVAQQKQQLASTDAFVDSLVTVIRGMFAGSPSTLADFGESPRKVATLTVQQKQLAGQKSAATRKARHTMGSKQKAAIKGVVPATPSATDTPAVVPVSVTPAVVTPRS